MLLVLIALAVAPGVAISLFIYSLNTYGKESIRHLLVSFVLGMAATLPALAVQVLVSDVREEPYHNSILSYIFYAFVIIAFSEEGSKYLVLRFYAYPKSFFSQPFDGVIYSVMIGMGFATVENIEYVAKFGLETGVSRFFLAVPAHASFAVLMGFPVGRAKFGARHPVWQLWKGLLIAVLFHGSFDCFLFLQQSRAAAKYVSTGVLSFGSFASFYIAVRLAMRAIRMHQARQNAEEERLWREKEGYPRHGAAAPEDQPPMAADQPAAEGQDKTNDDDRREIPPPNPNDDDDRPKPANHKFNEHDQ